MWGQGGVYGGYVGVRCVKDVTNQRNPIIQASCAKLGELHKDMIGVNIRGSPNEALAFWYDVYMGYESKGGAPPLTHCQSPPPAYPLLIKVI